MPSETPGTGGPTETSYPEPEEVTSTPESGNTLTPTLTPTITNTLPPGVTPSPTQTFTVTLPSGGTPPPGLTPSQAGPTASSTSFLTPTPPNVFRTEDAEVGGSKVTAPASETPEETSTLTETPVPTRTRTRRPTIVAGADEGGIRMDWGLFWIGFSLPVMVICGVILYLLDHRPEIFSFRK